jgi:hypothetical protein
VGVTWTCPRNKTKCQLQIPNPSVLGGSQWKKEGAYWVENNKSPSWENEYSPGDNTARISGWEIKKSSLEKSPKKLDSSSSVLPDSPLGLMLLYWAENSRRKDKNKTKNDYILFCHLDQEPILRPSVFWPKFGSDEDWDCQVLIEHITDKSQEEIEYAFCWQRGPMICSCLKCLRLKTLNHKKTKANGSPLIAFLPLMAPLGPAPERSPSRRPESP